MERKERLGEREWGEDEEKRLGGIPSTDAYVMASALPGEPRIPLIDAFGRRRSILSAMVTFR